jgi:hypothetical protein
MIAEQYIQEGIRIRKSYIKNLKEILKQEPIIQDRKIKFQELQKEMESIVNSDLNDVRKTLQLNEKLIILDKEMKNVQDIIKPFHDNIEKLRDDKDKLYLAIKEKYPNITQQEIEKDIMSKVEE